MESEDVLKIAWVVFAVLLASAEIVVPGFVLLPFGIGAAVGAIAAFAGANFAIQLLCFVVASALAFAALRPLARRLNQAEQPQGVGANRLISEQGVVIDAMGPNDPGMVRVDREDWRAEAVDGTAIGVGARVEVVEVRGTRVLVRLISSPMPDRPPASPPEGNPS